MFGIFRKLWTMAFSWRFFDFRCFHLFAGYAPTGDTIWLLPTLKFVVFYIDCRHVETLKIGSRKIFGLPPPPLKEFDLAASIPSAILFPFHSIQRGDCNYTNNMKNIKSTYFAFRKPDSKSKRQHPFGLNIPG